MNKWSWAGIAVLSVVVAVVAVFTVIDEVDSQQHGSNSAAYYACTDYVRDRLKAPATADFPPYNGGVSRSGDTYRVNGYVDSENSFGANLRTNFTCSVSYDDGRWELDDIAVRE